MLIINQEEFEVFSHSYFLSKQDFFLFLIDYQSNEWTVNEQTGKKERMCTYNVQVSAVFGETTISSNEKQVHLLFFSFILII